MWVRTVHCLVVLFRTVACIRSPWIVWVQVPPVGSRLLSRKRWIFGSCLGWPLWEVDWDKGLEIWSLVSILCRSLDLNMWVFRALGKKIGPKKMFKIFILIDNTTVFLPFFAVLKDRN